jgi:hypothetical protein
LRDSVFALERDLDGQLAAIPLKHLASARNLVHYLAVTCFRSPSRAAREERIFSARWRGV